MFDSVSEITENHQGACLQKFGLLDKTTSDMIMSLASGDMIMSPEDEIKLPVT